MQEIKAFKMGFGESLLLSDNNECLLVDFGSESADKKGYFAAVGKELDKYQRKSAMLSHFHADHINGYMELVKNLPHTFEKVYIPHIFSLKHPNLTDLEIIKYILENQYCPYEKTLTLWGLLELLCIKHQNIQLLRRSEKAFRCAGDIFDVLWPIPDNLVNKELYKKLTQIIDVEMWSRIFTISDQINQTFIALSENREIDNEEVLSIEGSILRLTNTFTIDKRNIKPDDVKRFIKSIYSNANKASIVCHNHTESKSILLTGDIPSVVMKTIAENPKLYPHIELFRKYDFIKVPHHGTDTHYFNFGCYTCFDNLLISNGNTNMKYRGLISRQYNLLNRQYNIYCTNTEKDRCQCLCKYPYTFCSDCVGNSLIHESYKSYISL